MKDFSLRLALLAGLLMTGTLGCGDGGGNKVIEPTASQAEMTEAEKKAFDAEKMKAYQEYMKTSGN